MQTRNLCWGVVVAAMTAAVFGAEPIQTLDLKPYVGPSAFETSGADWLLPKGRQVFAGTPFQIDGVILLYGDNWSQHQHPARTNVNGIAVGKKFERLHLLVGSEFSDKDGEDIAKIQLAYSNGSNSVLQLRYGEQVRDWYGPRHKADDALKDPTVREVWLAQCSEAAAYDKYLRLFHVVLTNPCPQEEVRTISLESSKRQAGLMVAAMSVGPADAPAETNTWTPPKSPLPDLRKRSGELAQCEGIVKSMDGQPVAQALVKVAETRKIDATSFETRLNDEGARAEAKTDAGGHFILPPLPDNMAYKLIIAADGFQPKTYAGADPKSDPIQVRLSPVSKLESPAKYVARGRLVGPDSRPVTGALLNTRGVGEEFGASWGGETGFPDELVSDANGEFVLGREKPFTRVQVDVRATGLAPANVWLDVTNPLNTIDLGVGAVFEGRVFKNGQPVSGVKIGISGTDRNSEVYAGHYETTTGSDGSFVFDHVPANKTWAVYGIISSLKSYGAIARSAKLSGGNGQTNDLGDLEVIPGIHLAGEIKTMHGEPLPKGLTVQLGVEDAWDFQSAKVDNSGHFEFDGLSRGPVTLNVNQSGWRPAGNNRSLDILNPWRLIGILEEDKRDLVLTIEKGERQFYGGASGNGQLPPQDEPQSRPIRGAEPGGPPPIILAGRIVDDRTGQPIAKCRLIPGYKPPASAGMPAPSKPLLKEMLAPFAKKQIPWKELPFWRYGLGETITNGTFALEFARLISTPMLRVEADGYLALETEPIPTNANALVLRLKTGAGPNGVVLLPNGKPASGATVVYAASREQFSLTGRSLTNYGMREGTLVTANDGKFSFSARAQGTTVFVAHPEGWATETVARGGNNLKLRLKPWAAIKGTLVNSNGTPMAGVELCFTLPQDWQRGDAYVNTQGRSTTDAQGQFCFINVPPQRVEVQRLVPMSAHSWMYQKQSWLEVTPGVTNDLGKVTYDSPPALPALEQLKQHLGL